MAEKQFKYGCKHRRLLSITKELNPEEKTLEEEKCELM